MIFLQGAIKVYRDFYKSLCMEVCSAKLCEGKIKFIAHRKGVQCERCVTLRKCGSVTVFMLIGIESSREIFCRERLVSSGWGKLFRVIEKICFIRAN